MPYPVSATPLNLLGNKKDDREKQLTRGAKQLGLGLIKVAQALDSIISVLLPSSPEYAIPYACLKVIFQVSFAHPASGSFANT
jgi:hypothetical protein